MVPPKKERIGKLFCKLCRRYDIPATRSSQHLRDVHNVDNTANRNMTNLKFFIFSDIA